MNGFGVLLRAALRRDRIRLGVLVVVLGLLPVATASSYKNLYPTAAERSAFDTSARNTPTLLTLYGRAGDLTTAGGFTAWRVGTFLALFTALVAAFTVVRHTRAEEDSGRAELVAANVVGRSAPTAVAATTALGTCLAVGLVTAVSLAGTGADPAGALLFAAVTALVGAVGGSAGLVAAQVFSTARAANGAASTAIVAAYLLRGVADGDPNLGWLGWVSPLGWPGRAEAFAANRWAVLALPALSAVALFGLARGLRLHRDLGAGLLPRRSGRPRAGAALSSGPALAWRLGRGAVLGWCAGLGLAGLALGSLTSSITDLLADNSASEELFQRFGGASSLTAAYLGTLTGVYALAVSAAGVQAAVHARAEESRGHLELLLGAGGSRLGWYLGHLSVGLLGSALALIAGVLGTRTTAGGSAPGWGEVLASGVGQLPAVWLVCAVGFALAGTLPRFTGLAWVVPGVCLLIWFTAPLLQLGRWFADISPFSHLPAAPGGGPATTAVLVISALTLVLVVTGAVVGTRRDLRSA